MRLSKLTRKQVMIIGILILVVVAAGGYFALIKGASERYHNAVKERDDARALAEQVPQLREDYEKTEQAHARAERRLNAIYAAKMPYISVKNPVDALTRLWNEYGDNGMGPILEKWARGTGNWVGTFGLPDVRTDPPPQDTKEIAVDLESFAITAKSFPKLLAFLRAMGTMPRLGSIKRVKVTGSTPALKVEAPMTVYLWTRHFTGAATGTGARPAETAQAGSGSSSSATSGAR
ncbi:hypothetical protein AMK68_04360 [candidate division KD3-62 bacterium DG_56]|uniref:Type 4a pilus biogenesis protein PilO n=1 Tax=candidate division KD3-62 bacterium DG_56 TaxID=1704032 RepID=A0A0S7XKB2_9BACT|nr:MAG: hypothetical protein AMK68_04360 [candidate division KD3-62 bacterium DG_56]